MNYHKHPEAVGAATKTGRLLDRAEELYLQILRAAVLVIATLLVLFAIGLAAYSLYRVSQSPDSVETAPVAVTAGEIVSAQSKVVAAAAGKPAENAEQAKAYQQFVAKYHQLFQKKFESFRQPEDKTLDRGEFDDNFVGSAARLEAISQGDLNFNNDIADLQKLYTAMAKAADLPEAQKRLKAYKAARKSEVCHNVEKTRTTYQRGWDRFSTACTDWYYDPIGCSVMRPVQSTYTDRQCAMEFPKGTQSHLQLFRAFQERYDELLTQRRDDAEVAAEAERQSIIEGIAEGKSGLGVALAVAGAFILLMFFFLLIAIERHQRRSALPAE